MTAYRDVDPTCPLCVRLLAASPGGAYACERCGGRWVAYSWLLEVLQRRYPERQLDELLEHNDGSARLPCPVCRELMDLVWLELLPFNRCADHGVWIDAGKLERAMAYPFPLDGMKPTGDT